MPTVTKFMADGVGNGFPFCGNRVDVDDFDHWTTLSGVNKDNPTTSPELIQSSLINAMKLYWNGYSTTSPSTAVGRFGTVASVTDIDNGLLIRSEPKSRVCGSVQTAQDLIQGAYAGARLTLAFGQPVRLYNDGEFVGYGAGTIVLTRGLAGLEAQTEVKISSYIENASSSTSTALFDYDYVLFGGIDFVCQAYAVTRRISGTRVANASTLSAHAEATLESLYESDSSITSFDFYTY